MLVNSVNEYLILVKRGRFVILMSESQILPARDTLGGYIIDARMYRHTKVSAIERSFNQNVLWLQRPGLPTD